MIKESKMLRNIIITGLIMMSILLIARIAYSVDLIPRERHFIYTKPPWYVSLFKKQSDFFVVKARIANSKKKLVEVKAQCEIVNIDEQGKITPTGKTVKVEPETVTLYPQEPAYDFKIFFPIKEYNSSTLALFSVMPISNNPKPGITITSGGGFVFGVSWVETELNLEPTFLAYKKDGIIYAAVENTSMFLMEGTLKLTKEGEPLENEHFFLQANKKRVFEIPNADCDAILFDVGGMQSIRGIRLRD